MIFLSNFLFFVFKLFNFSSLLRLDVKTRDLIIGHCRLRLSIALYCKLTVSEINLTSHLFQKLGGVRSIKQIVNSFFIFNYKILLALDVNDPPLWFTSQNNIYTFFIINYYTFITLHALIL